MLTLKTLPKASAQEIFDQVAVHLLTQKEKSMDGAACKYRSSDGLKCAAGCLIADDEYSEDIEGSDWQGAVDILIEEDDSADLEANYHTALIAGLQRIHDDSSKLDWLFELTDIAHTYRLNTDILAQFKKSNE
jgi:hypothetical protein